MSTKEIKKEGVKMKVRRNLILLMLILTGAICVGGLSVSFAQGHYYFNGKVISIEGHFINISGKTFKIVSECKVSIQKEKNGIFFQSPASWKNIKIGDWVTVKVVYDTVYEILIERYKK